MNDPGEVVILGAGLTGMSTAYHLRRAGHRQVSVYEKEDEAGGLARSFSVGDHRFDFTGHFLHLRDPEIKRLVAEWCGDGFTDVERNAWIHSNGVFTPYPFQTNLHGQPPEVVRDCLLGYIDARSRDARRESGEAAPVDFATWIMDNVGEGIAKHFMIPYNTKLWGVPPAGMTTDWMKRFVPPAPLDKVVSGALGLRDDGAGYNASFLYPRDGGIQLLSEGLRAQLGPIGFGHEVTHIDAASRRVRFANGDEAGYRRLVSTLPLPLLCDLIDELPKAVREARAQLRSSSVWALCLGLSADHTEGRHWVYVPESHYPFYRAGCFSNVATGMAPPGHATIWVERSYNEQRPLDDDSLRDQCVAGLKRMGWLHDEAEIAAETQLRIPDAYVIYDHNHARATNTIHAHLDDLGIISTGRYGKWNYSSMEDALIDGREAAGRLLGLNATPTPGDDAPDLK